MRNVRNIRLLALHNFLVDFVLFAPIAILYYQRVSGSFTLGMSVISIAMLSSALFEIPTGIVSDKVGRKLTVVFGTLSYALSTILYAIGLSYWYLVVGSILAGLGRSFYSGNNDALLFDTLAERGKEGKYEHYLGRTMSTGQAALAISALLGGVIAHFSFSLVMWLSVVPQVINVFVGFMFDEPKSHTEKIDTNIYEHFIDSLKRFIKNGKIRTLSSASVVAYSFGESAYQFRAAFVEQLWPIWAIGISNVLSNIGASLSFYFSGSLIKRFTAKTLLIIGKAYSIVISLAAFLFPSVLSPLLLTTSSVFFGSNTTAKNNLFQREFTHTQRATMSSINSFFGSIGFAIVSIFVGYFADKYGATNALIMAFIVQVVPLYLYINFFKKT